MPALRTVAIVVVVVGMMVLPTSLSVASTTPTGGGVWSEAVLTTGADAVYCASPTACTAVSRDGDFLTYNGSGWSTQRATPFPQSLGWWQVSCPATDFCLATGYDDRAYSYDGEAWSEISPQSLGYAPAISCASKRFCMVVTSLGDAFTYNGVSWAQVASLPDYPPETITAYGPPSSYWAPAISCASASFCAVFTIGGKGYIYDGERWVEQIIEPRPNYTVQSEEYDWVAISCAVAGYCEVVENNGDAIDYTNGTWGSPQHVLTGLQHPVFVQCPTPNYCVAASSHETFTFNGATWLQTVAPPISLGVEMGSLSCPTVGFCAASADNGSVHLFRAAATLSLEATSAHLTYGAEQNERLSVELSSSASSVTGIVTITSPTGTVCSIRIVNGTGNCQLTPTQLPTGSTDLTADYSGTPTLAAASDQLLLTVAKVPVKVTLVLTHATARLGAEQSVRFDVFVVPRYAGNATGSVVIKLVSGRVLCILTLDPEDTTSHGSCTLSNTELAVGTVAVEASFVGTDIFASGVSAPGQLRIVASTASTSGASGTIDETCECQSNINGTWDYLTGPAGDAISDNVVYIDTLTLHSNATDQVTGTEVDVSAYPVPTGYKSRYAVTGHISRGHLYILLHPLPGSSLSMAQGNGEYWTSGNLAPPPAGYGANCLPDGPDEGEVEPLPLALYPDTFAALFYPESAFLAVPHGVVPHLGIDPGVDCVEPSVPTDPPAIHTTCSAVNLENSPPGKIGGRGGFDVTFTMLPGYYPSNSGEYFYIWSFDATITRPSGPGSPGGNYPFGARNKEPASLKLGHPVRLRLPSGGAAWGTEGMPMKDYRCSVTHLSVVLESPLGE